MNYNDFNEETKIYLNKVMDIYSSIENNDINIRLVTPIVKVTHNLNKYDKKIMSLFMASFLVGGDLNHILSQYDDIKLRDMLNFLKITQNDIKPIKDGKYEEYYKSNIQLELISIIQGRNKDYNINSITPEVIVGSLQNILESGSAVLDYFAYVNHLLGAGMSGFGSHPFFSALVNSNIITGRITKKEKPKDIGVDEFFSMLFPNSASANGLNPNPAEGIKNNGQPSGTKDAFVVDEHTWQILDEIQSKFIGQEAATESLFYNIIHNQELANKGEVHDGDRAIIFLDGPTGTGKTAITREITNKLDIPFCATSITNYSATGYVGGNITDLLKILYDKAGGDIEKAQRGILVLDEIDKITTRSSNGLEMKRAVQQQLLDFLGGGKYTIKVGNSMFGGQDIEFDTSKLTFVCLGALTDLRTNKTTVKPSFGFNDKNEDVELLSFEITPEDLVKIGLEKELVGRFNAYLHTDEYNVDSLENILRKSKISPLIGLINFIESHEKQLVIDEDVYHLIAQKAYELNTGARSLQTIINCIRTNIMKEVYRGNDKTIHLNAEIVIKSSENAVNRKGRV